MTDISPARINIQQEETAFDAAVSEATLSRVGAGINFINQRQASLMLSGVFGPYNIITPPQLQVSELMTFPFNFEIVALYIFSGTLIGTGGTTELDLKWKPQTSGSYASIFSTTPKFTTTAAASQSCYAGQSVTGFTAPVLSKTTFNAYDQLRLDLIQAMTGPVEGAGLGIWIRPR